MLVCGVGINDFEGRIKIDGKHIDSYSLWRGVLKRVYKTSTSGREDNYRHCSVVDEWHRFSVFKDWYDSQFKQEGWQLDKDILFHGNKVYGPSTCVFVPHEINKIICPRKNGRGDYLLGVSYRPNKSTNYPYIARCYMSGKRIELGRYKTEQEAHNSWRTAKSKEIVDACSRYGLEGDVKYALLKIADNLLDFDTEVDSFY